MDYTKLFRLDGKHAVVIGAGSGIGRESALALAAHGARVTCADRDLAAARETAASALAAYELDVLDDAAIERAVVDLDPVDVLVFPAATNGRKRIVDYTGDEFDRVVALNLRASFQLIRAFGKTMADRGRGSIIGF